MKALFLQSVPVSRFNKFCVKQTKSNPPEISYFRYRNKKWCHVKLLSTELHSTGTVEDRSQLHNILSHFAGSFANQVLEGLRPVENRFIGKLLGLHRFSLWKVMDQENVWLHFVLKKQTVDNLCEPLYNRHLIDYHENNLCLFICVCLYIVSKPWLGKPSQRM